MMPSLKHFRRVCKYVRSTIEIVHPMFVIGLFAIPVLLLAWCIDIRNAASAPPLQTLNIIVDLCETVLEPYD